MGIKEDEKNITITVLREDIEGYRTRDLFYDLVDFFKDLAKSVPSSVFLSVLDKHPMAEKLIDAIDKRRERIGNT